MLQSVFFYIPPEYQPMKEYYNRHITTAICALSTILIFTLYISAEVPRILVFSKTAGWDHNTRIIADSVITHMGAAHHFSVICSQSATPYFSAESLSTFSAICFVNTTGSLFTTTERAAFQNYIENGGGFVGIHAATDAEYDWPWYGTTIGATFNGHPCNVSPAQIAVTDKNHPSTSAITADTLNVTDEWYFWGSNPDFRNYPLVNPATDSTVHVLLELVESSLTCIPVPLPHPICWMRQQKSGKIWYCGLGHDPAMYKDPLFQQLLLGGIQYAAHIDGAHLQAPKTTRIQPVSRPSTSSVPFLLDLRGRKLPAVKGISGTTRSMPLLNVNSSATSATPAAGVYYQSKRTTAKPTSRTHP